MKKREITLEYQNLIFEPPVEPAKLYAEACSNDDNTIKMWRETWLSNIRANHEKHGPFSASGIGSEFGKHRFKPIIIAGSGPSLKYNAKDLKDRRGIPLVSCLHNFHYMEDLGIAPEYYTTLDAGKITISEVSEGGSKSEDEYWEITKDRTLIAYVGTHPELINKWRGRILWYQAPVPDDIYREEAAKIEDFHQLMSTGGNVLGACLYFAKAVLGGSVTIFVGADFCFGYDRKFHSWDSKYDKVMGRCVPVVDIFGNKVPTWNSYAGFKKFFEVISLRVPGLYLNCTEGGALGSYPDGNLNSFKYMDLKQALDMFNMCDRLAAQMTQANCNKEDKRKILF